MPEHIRALIAILVLTFVLSGLSTRFVEDPVRTSAFLRNRRPRLTYGLTLVAMAAVIVPSAVAIVVSDRATSRHLPSAAALGEAVRRRRATGGASEQLFGQLVGLEMRPRRLRDAANLFAALEDSSDAHGRDAAWAHPDVAPSAADLDDPLGYVQRTIGSERTELSDDLDAALEAILAGEDARRSAEDADAEGPADAGGRPQHPGLDDDGEGSSDGSTPGHP